MEDRMSFDGFPKYFQLFTELGDLVKQKLPQEYETFRSYNMDLAFKLRDLELICLRYEADKKKWNQHGKRLSTFIDNVKSKALSQNELQQESEILGKQGILNSELLLLDIDSFFIFARILLDRIPLIIGPLQKNIVTKQDISGIADFKKYLDWFEKNPQDVLDTEFYTKMISFRNWFYKKLRDPRNEIIVHSRRGIIRSEIGFNGKVTLLRHDSKTIGKKKLWRITKTLELTDISEYIKKIIEFLEFLSKYFSEKLSGL